MKAKPQALAKPDFSTWDKAKAPDQAQYVDATAKDDKWAKEHWGLTKAETLAADSIPLAPSDGFGE